MAHFIGNDSITFDVEKITVVHWNCCGEERITRVEIIFTDGNEVYLHFQVDADYKLINDLRDYFGYKHLPQVI